MSPPIDGRLSIWWPSADKTTESSTLLKTVEIVDVDFGHGRLQLIIDSAQRMIDCSLPSLYDLYTPGSWGQERLCPAPPTLVTNFLNHYSHRKLKSIRNKSSQYKNSFLTAAGLINKVGAPYTCHLSLICSGTDPAWGHVWMGAGISILGNLYS